MTILQRVADFVTPLKNRVQFTPDFKELKKSKLHLVFVFDEYQDNLFGSIMFEGCKYLGRGRTVGNIYRLFVNQQGYPEVYKGGLNGTRVIAGDVYAVPTHKLMELDGKYENGTFTERDIIYIYLEDQMIEKTQMLPSVPCFMWLSPTPVQNMGGDVLSLKEYRAKIPCTKHNSILPLVQEYSPLA